MMEIEQTGKTLTVDVAKQDGKHTPKVSIESMGYGDVYKIGSGTFGTVWHIRENGKRYALKIGKRDVMASEIKLMRRIMHKNVVEVRKAHEMLNTTALVMKLAKCDLGQYVRSRPCTTEATLKFMYQLFSGLEAIHKHKIIHGDIKPENLLWYEEDRILKIADFGISVSFTENDLPKEHDVMCSINFRPPEISLGIGYTTSIDIWSAGCVMYFTATGGRQFLPSSVAALWPNAASGKFDPEKHLKYVWRHIRNTDLDDEDLLFCFSNLDEEFIEKQKSVCYTPAFFSDKNKEKEDFIWKTMTFNPSRRITATEALKSSIFSLIK